MSYRKVCSSGCCSLAAQTSALHTDYYVLYFTVFCLVFWCLKASFKKVPILPLICDFALCSPRFSILPKSYTKTAYFINQIIFEFDVGVKLADSENIPFCFGPLFDFLQFFHCKLLVFSFHSKMPEIRRVFLDIVDDASFDDS